MSFRFNLHRHEIWQREIAEVSSLLFCVLWLLANNFNFYWFFHCPSAFLLCHYLFLPFNGLASISVSFSIKISPNLNGPTTFLLMIFQESGPERTLTLACLPPSRVPIEPTISITCAGKDCSGTWGPFCCLCWACCGGWPAFSGCADFSGWACLF